MEIYSETQQLEFINKKEQYQETIPVAWIVYSHLFQFKWPVNVFCWYLEHPLLYYPFTFIITKSVILTSDQNDSVF